MAAPTARTARRSETPSADGRPHRRPGRPMARSPAVTAPAPLDVTIAPAGSGRIAAVCTVAELFPVPERDLMSGIDKRPVQGPITLLPHGVLGDVQGDRENHGGIFKAVYAFSREVREDRKSTRLNSSHVAISYAVFCLKKKIG